MTDKVRQIVIFGTGEMADMARYYMTHDSGFEGQVVAFTADDRFVEGKESYKGLPLVPFSRVADKYPPGAYEGHVALSYGRLNQTRKEKYELMKEKGYSLVSYVCSRSSLWPDLSVGENCMILENQTIQPNVKIENNVMMWSGNHIGHGTEIGDHTYISSHVCISGYSRIGSRCFFGVNSATRDYVKIGDDVFVAMGALVTKDVGDGMVVLGPRCEILDSTSELALRLKRKYFNMP